MNAQEKYQEWLSRLDPKDPMAAELEAIKEDRAEIEERFALDLTFGTAGLRGKLKAGTNCMNFITIGWATQGIADYMKAHGQNALDKGIIIAHDPRHFSKEFSQLTASILAANGIRVYAFPDLRPTPELAFMIRRLGTASGINITASHNPKDYNGYKVYWSDGCQISGAVSDGMAETMGRVGLFDQIGLYGKADASLADRCSADRIAESYEKGVADGAITILGTEYDRMYLDRIEALAVHSGSDLALDIPIVYTPQRSRLHSLPYHAEGPWFQQLADCTGTGKSGPGFHIRRLSQSRRSQGLPPV